MAHLDLFNKGSPDNYFWDTCKFQSDRCLQLSDVLSLLRNGNVEINLKVKNQERDWESKRENAIVIGTNHNKWNFIGSNFIEISSQKKSSSSEGRCNSAFKGAKSSCELSNEPDRFGKTN